MQDENRQEQIDRLCRKVYEQTKSHDDFKHAKRVYGLGFEILLGRPFHNAEYMFIGYQPGKWPNRSGREREVSLDEYEIDWFEDTCQYATKRWRLACQIRKLFDEPSLLERCVGTNAIFLRADSISVYERLVESAARRRIKEHCLKHLREMLEAINPRRIVVVGFSTANTLGVRTLKVVESRHGTRPLLKQGLLFERTVFVTPHLSASWGLRDADIQRIKSRLEVLSHS